MKGKKAHRKGDGPGTDEVDGDFFPRLSNFVAGWELAIARAGELVTLAMVAAGHKLGDTFLELGDPKVSAQRGADAIDSGVA